MIDRIEDRGIMTHLIEIGPLSELVIDLKKQLLGHEFNPITMERLDECTKSIGKIQQCRKHVLFK